MRVLGLNVHPVLTNASTLRKAFGVLGDVAQNSRAISFEGKEMSKIIVITGAGAGLGRAMAHRFAKDGDSVVLLGRNRQKLETVASPLGSSAMAVSCDVSKPDSVTSAFGKIAKRHGRIDVLINNAACFMPFLLSESTEEQILQTIGTNLTGPILCARAAIPLMGRGGHILNISSESVEMPYPHLSLYVSTKAGLESFSLSLYRELEPSGIRVTCVRAGRMATIETTWEGDVQAFTRFLEAAAKAGLNLMERPMSHYDSVADVFRHLIDVPADVHPQLVSLHGWKANC
jgi:NAD(P)-dependent dehydrogenase (short-subunit alcohol dehydrogenase family)